MNGVFGGGLFAVSTLKSPPMQLRDGKFDNISLKWLSLRRSPFHYISIYLTIDSPGRLKEAKSHSDRIQRELARDRMSLERREKTMVCR